MTARANNTLPNVPDGSVVYAIGDIHGELELLDKLHAMVDADARSRDARRKVIVYLGDYIDRGPDPAGIVGRLTAESPPGFERVFLMGNHEDFLLQFLALADNLPGWLLNGGLQTLESYGVGLRRADGWMKDPRALRDEFDSKLPDRHRQFFESLSLCHIEGDYLFVHAGIRPGRALNDQKRTDMLWIRGEFLNSDADFGHVVVHGHTPRDHVEIRPNRIGIDTGAVYGGQLTALVLEGADRAFLQV